MSVSDTRQFLLALLVLVVAFLVSYLVGSAWVRRCATRQSEFLRDDGTERAWKLRRRGGFAKYDEEESIPILGCSR